MDKVMDTSNKEKYISEIEDTRLKAQKYLEWFMSEIDGCYDDIGKLDDTLNIVTKHHNNPRLWWEAQAIIHAVQEMSAIFEAQQKGFKKKDKENIANISKVLLTVYISEVILQLRRNEE
jgi:hypothetical protein